MTISNHGHLTARRIGVGAVTSAVVSGLLLVVNPTSASAATNVNVTTGDIRGDESTYTGWHQGYANAALSAGITSAGLVMKGQSQIIRGYSNNDNTGLTTTGVNADLDTVLPGASYDVKAGSAYFQVPLFVDQDDQVNTPPVFTTLRPAVAAISNDTIALTDSWISTNTVGTIAEDTAYPLSQILTEIGLHPSKTLAFGVLSDDAGTVGSITWDGTTYTFTDGALATSTVRNADVRTVETSATYTSWHQGYDNAPAAQQVTADGLVLAGKSQVIKGYANNSDILNAVNANLRFVLPEASYTVAPDSGAAFFQVAVKFDDNGTTKFATLRNGGEGSGTNTFALTDHWQSSKAIGTIPANTDAELGDLIDALGKYKTIGFGVLTNAGTTSTVSNITFANRSYNFGEAAATPTTTVVRARDIGADESTYAGWHQGAPAPAGTINAGVDSTVLNLGAVRSQLLYGFANNNNDLDNSNGVDLVDALTGASYTVASGDAYFQVALFAADPQSGSTVYTTLRPAAPAEPGLNRVNVGQEWVSSKALGDVPANTPVLLGDLLSPLTSVKVIGYGVYTDAGGNAKISDVTFDGARTTFTGNRAPASAAVTGSTTSGHAVTLPLKGTDADGDTVTYTVATPAKGTAVVTGDKVKFTAPVGYVGTASFSYTSNDGQGATKDGTVTIKVGKVASTLSLKATKGAGKKTFITVKVSAPGAVVTGGQVEIKRAGKTVAKGKVAANGSVKLLVGKKLKGTKVFTVTYKGTASATPVTKKISVKIK